VEPLVVGYVGCGLLVEVFAVEVLELLGVEWVKASRGPYMADIGLDDLGSHRRDYGERVEGHDVL
jgi:hypothetical protein